jgi:glycosyltransferase involved in cell wall biosynthesis
MTQVGKTLYIAYFGLREPLVQNQVLPYLRALVAGGVSVSLLTFEREPAKLWKADSIEEQRSKLSAEGIEWSYLTYHKRLSVIATAYDVLCGAIFTARHVARNNTHILHARVHMPAAMAVIAKKLSLNRKPKVLFDIRGFMPEEYTDAGVWPAGGLLFRVVKRVERWLLRESDGFVVLTERARGILFRESSETGCDREGRPVEVIPCCVDLAKFVGADATSRKETRAKIGIPEEAFVACYVGSFGGWYLTEETLRFFSVLKKVKANAFAMVLTKNDPEPLVRALKAVGYGDNDYFVGSVPPEDVPRHLAGADMAVSFIKKCYSKQASSPTKNAEYLACGLPILINEGIGDSDAHVIEDRTGVVIDGFAEDALSSAIHAMDELLAEGEALSSRCRESAERRYDLHTIGAEAYRRIYRALSEREGGE